MVGEILLIRHGETAWNREAIFRGRADIPLSARGREQARLLGEALSSQPVRALSLHPLRAVYASPLSRARETAAPLAEGLGLEVVAEPRLIDMSFGEWEGKPLDEVRGTWPSLYRAWLAEPQTFRAPGGESLEEVLGRALPAMTEIAARHEGAAALVSHRVVCKALLCAALGAGAAGFWRVQVDTASVSLLKHTRDGWVVLRTNDTHHLEALAGSPEADF